MDIKGDRIFSTDRMNSTTSTATTNPVSLQTPEKQMIRVDVNQVPGAPVKPDPNPHRCAF